VDKHCGQPTKHRAVVTGLGIIVSNGRNVPDFLRSLQEGIGGMRPIRDFDASGYCNQQAGVVEEDLAAALGNICPSDRAIRLALISAREAVHDADLTFAEGLGKRTVVTVGTSLGGWGSYIHALRTECRENPTTDFSGPFDCILDVSPGQIAAHLCDEFGISGGNLTTTTACAAGSNSIALAVDMIRQGRSEVVLACATDPLCELSYSGFNILMAMASGVSRPFDRNRAGLMVGEGSGTIIVEELEHAVRRGARIYCELAGYGLSNDAYHATQPDPEAGGACRAIKRALLDAGVVPTEVDYINAHGTSTKYNDLMELKAIRKIYGEAAEHIPISSIKSMVGHTLGAAGTIEAIATILAMHHKFLPPTLNFSTPIDGFEYDFVPKSRPAERANVMSSHSFGFGGNAACLVFRNAEPELPAVLAA
jgi:3-oxoacyl-[acyl-carrier-protein] synthase II